jgi:hypothetical protein
MLIILVENLRPVMTCKSQGVLIPNNREFKESQCSTFNSLSTCTALVCNITCSFKMLLIAYCLLFGFEISWGHQDDRRLKPNLTRPESIVRCSTSWKINDFWLRSYLSFYSILFWFLKFLLFTYQVVSPVTWVYRAQTSM